MEGSIIVDQPGPGKGYRSTAVTEQGSLPKCLQQLAAASELKVSQHIDPVEVVLCCFNRPCRYSVHIDDCEEQLLYVQEVSDCYARQIMGAGRGFTLKFSDSDMRDVICVVRPQTCSRGSCAVCCTLPTLEVQTPPGITKASIIERRTCCLPTYDIVNMDDQLLYSFQVNCFTCKAVCCWDTNISICDTKGETVAKLVKPANFGECIGKSNNFTIQFSDMVTLTAVEKIILLGSMFLVDFHHFERQNRCCC